MMGAPQASDVAAEDRERVNNLKDKINQKLGKNHQSYEVVKVSHQVVAGTNHFYHLTGKPDNSKVTVTIYEPLPHNNQPSEVSQATEGHNTLQIGHGQ